MGNTIWTVSYFLVLIGLSLFGLHRYVIVYLYLKNRRNVPQTPAAFETLPPVTVQLPIFNEYYVVERLLKSVGELDYPRDLLQIQLLDDSTDDTRELAAAKVVEMKAAGFDIERIHRTDRTGFKAGALANAMPACKGEFIMILDADFVPPPDFLRRTIHYFTDEKIGMVQTRWGHLNRGYSLLTRVQALFIDSHFLIEQVARSRSGRFFNFNGTAGVWRRSCIEDAGGWEHDTLTEDLDLSYRAQLKNWKFIFLEDLVTPGELPVEMNGFKSQQHRWAKGSVQTCLKLLPALWKSREPLRVKIEGLAHVSSYFICLLLALMCLLVQPTIAPVSQHSAWRLAAVDVPLFLFTSLPFLAYNLFVQRVVDPKGWWKGVLLLPVMVAFGAGVSINNAFAVAEALLGIQSGFVRTPKYGIENRSQTWKKRRYAPLKSLLVVVEFAFAAYFAWLVVYALQHAAYGTMPFLVLFAGGFAYVAWHSLSAMLPAFPRWPARQREPREAVPA
jgi:cellulose synthase/poly-beta-1,6-N-acetylglucosamine synthase-like glycosyltransferase